MAQGKSFSAAVTKVAVLSANVNVSVYAVRYLYPAYGLLLGTLFSFVISLVSVCLVYLFVKKKMD